MSYYTFQNLQPLCSSMGKSKKSLEVFSFTYKLQFECLLDLAENPFQMLVGIPGANFAFVLKIEKGYKAKIEDSDYFRLCELLNLTYKNDQFSSFSFLKFVDSNIPKQCTPNLVPPEKILKFKEQSFSQKEREEGFIFCGWLPHKGRNNGHLNKDENLPKTRKIFGTYVADFCERNDISSKWTIDETKRVIPTFPPLD